MNLTPLFLLLTLRSAAGGSVEAAASSSIEVRKLQSVPPEWVCAPELFGTGNGCDCECGIVDPDCADPD